MSAQPIGRTITLHKCIINIWTLKLKPGHGVKECKGHAYTLTERCQRQLNKVNSSLCYTSMQTQFRGNVQMYKE